MVHLAKLNREISAKLDISTAKLDISTAKLDINKDKLDSTNKLDTS